MGWRVDGYTSGVGWLETTGTINPYVFIFDDVVPNTYPDQGTELTYTLRDDAGTVVVTGTATVVEGPRAAISIALPYDLDVSRIYVETWSGTIDSSVINYDREARASKHAASRRWWSITPNGLLVFGPVFDPSKAPAAWSGAMTNACAAGHNDVMARLFSRGPRGEIAGMARISRAVALKAAIHYLDAIGSVQAALRETLRLEYEAWWEQNDLAVDNDGNGTIDSTASPAGARGSGRTAAGV